MSSFAMSSTNGNRRAPARSASADAFNFEALLDSPEPQVLEPVAAAAAADSSTLSMGDLLAQSLAMESGGSTAAAAPAATPIPGDSLHAAFSAAVSDAAYKPDHLLQPTENGDAQFAEMTIAGYTPKVEQFVGDCLAMGQKSIMDQMKAATAASKPKGSGRKRVAQAARPDDAIEAIPESQRRDIDSRFTGLVQQIRSCTSDTDRAQMIVILAKMCFRERAVRASSSKGHRSLSYYWMSLFHKEFPVYARALVPLFVEYGCVRDLDALIAHFIDKDVLMVDAAVSKYVEMLDSDVRVVTMSDAHPNGRGFTTCDSYGPVLTHAQLNKGFKALASKVRTMIDKGSTPAEISDKFPHIKGLTNAAKWMKRVGKHNSKHRSLIVHAAMTVGGLAAAQKRGTGYMRFCDQTFRYVISSLTALSGVVESMMAAGNWRFDPKKMPAGATYKYRIAWANEVVGETVPYQMDETGNRYPHDVDRVALRKALQSAAVEGALKGAALDSTKFADAIWPKLQSSISKTDRLVLHAQFMDLCKTTKEKLVAEYTKNMAEWKEAGSPSGLEPVNPLNVISTIDVSGSMGSIMQYAVVNGIIGAIISDLGRWFITFSGNPQLINLCDGDIVDWMTQVNTSPWGGNTNMDKANQLLIKVMNKVRKHNKSFDGRICHIIHTDGQFDPYFAGFSETGRDYSYGPTDSKTIAKAWTPFVERMKTRFTSAKFALPMTAFWNYRSKTTGFPAHGKFEGVKLVEGLSSGLMFETLSGKITFKKDKSGVIVADVDPISSLINALAHPDFDLVADTIYATADGLFAKDSVVDATRSFWTAYAPKPKPSGGGGASAGH